MSVVNGKDVVLSINRSGDWQAVACNAVCSMHFEREFLETTFRDSTDIRTFVPFKGTISLDGSGPIEYDAAFTADDIINLWYASTLIQWTFVLTDGNGHDPIEKEYTGYGYLKSVDLTGDVQQAAMCDYTIIVSGDITGIDEGVGGGGSGATDFYEETFTEFVDGQTVLGSGEWIGVTMIEVLRNGVGLEILTSGTATEGSQVLYNSVAGTLTFGAEMGEGEYVQIIWGS